MEKMFFFAAFVLTFGVLAYGAQQSRIELTDGSTVEGEVLSSGEGKYLVKSSSLGMLTIEKSKVRDIRGVGPVAPSSQKEGLFPGGLSGQSEIQKMLSGIVGNMDALKALPGMFASPDFQAILKDPEVIKAVKSMDVKAFMANEKVVQFIQKIKEKNS